MTCTTQELADIQYGKGYRDGKVEAIFAILDQINDSDLEYVSNEIVTYLEKLDRQARKRRDSYK